MSYSGTHLPSEEFVTKIFFHEHVHQMVNECLGNIIDAFPIIEQQNATSTIKGCFFDNDKTRILLKVGFENVGLGDLACASMIVNKVGWEYTH